MAVPTITFPAIPDKQAGATGFVPTATSDSPAPITFTSSNPDVARIVGNEIQVLDAGEAEITTNQEALPPDWDAAAPVVQILRVTESTAINSILTELLPPNLTLTPTFVALRMKYWMLWLFDAEMHQVSHITPENVLQQQLYPLAFQVLIAKLIIWDQIQKNITGAAMGATSSQRGGIKRMEQGPSVVEWHNALDYFANFGKPGGMYDILSKDICSLGNELGVRLPMCPAVPQPHGFIIGRKRKPGNSATRY